MPIIAFVIKSEPIKCYLEIKQSTNEFRIRWNRFVSFINTVRCGLVEVRPG